LNFFIALRSFRVDRDTSQFDLKRHPRERGETDPTGAAASAHHPGLSQPQSVIGVWSSSTRPVGIRNPTIFLTISTHRHRVLTTAESNSTSEGLQEKNFSMSMNPHPWSALDGIYLDISLYF
jgi:hypothetical protein